MLRKYKSLINKKYRYICHFHWPHKQKSTELLDQEIGVAIRWLFCLQIAHPNQQKQSSMRVHYRVEMLIHIYFFLTQDQMCLPTILNNCSCIDLLYSFEPCNTPDFFTITSQTNRSKRNRTRRQTN